jgi:outer membrane cobalamin receptor
VNVKYSPIQPLNFNVGMNVVGTRRDVDPVRFTNFDNGSYPRMDFAASHDLGLWNDFFRHLRVYGRIGNLLDEKYDEAAGFPQPGFRIVGGYRLDFRGGANHVFQALDNIPGP